MYINNIISYNIYHSGIKAPTSAVVKYLRGKRKIQCMHVLIIIYMLHSNDFDFNTHQS